MRAIEAAFSVALVGVLVGYGRIVAGNLLAGFSDLLVGGWVFFDQDDGINFRHFINP